MDNQQERFELCLAWLAGILEGEGWVSLALVKSNQKNGSSTPAFQPNIGMVNCDFEIMNEVIRILEQLQITFRKNHRKAFIGSDGISRKEKIEVSITLHQHIRKFINIIVPYMIGAKKNRCLKLIEYLDIRATKPRCGKAAKYGQEEYSIYKSMYAYKGKRSTRSKILNDYTLEFESPNKI